MIRSIIMLLATSLTGLNAPAVLLAPNDANVTETALIQTISDNVSILNAEQKGDGVVSEREIVKNYFADIPIMIDIARCESNFRHTGKNGEVLRGISNNLDVGVMQINEYYHLEKSKKIEMDIYSIQGNLEFARYLYEKEGVRPWKASEKCWGSNV